MSYVKINGIKTDAGKNIHNANVSHKYFIQHSKMLTHRKTYLYTIL